MLSLQQFGRRFFGNGQLRFKSQRKFSSINMGYLNASGSGNYPAKVRNAYIGKFLKERNPNLMFFQEFSKLGPVTKKWKEYDLNPYYKYFGDGESSMLYDSKVLELKPLGVKSLELLDENEIIFSRLSACLFKDIKDDIWFLAASWHGPHKAKQEYKIELLESLLDTLTKIKEIEKVEYMILNGDFNLPIEKATEVIPKNLKIFGYETEVRADKDVIDYCITSDNFPMKEVNAEEVPEEYLEAFDHGLGTGTAHLGTDTNSGNTDGDKSD